MKRKSTCLPSRASRVEEIVAPSWESPRTKTTFCPFTAKERNTGISDFGYPPPKPPLGLSMLTRVAEGAATRLNRNSVPPLAVPISKTVLGPAFATIERSAEISSLICIGLTVRKARQDEYISSKRSPTDSFLEKSRRSIERVAL